MGSAASGSSTQWIIGFPSHVHRFSCACSRRASSRRCSRPSILPFIGPAPFLEVANGYRAVREPSRPFQTLRSATPLAPLRCRCNPIQLLLPAQGLQASPTVARLPKSCRRHGIAKGAEDDRQNLAVRWAIVIDNWRVVSLIDDSNKFAVAIARRSSNPNRRLKCYKPLFELACHISRPGGGGRAGAAARHSVALGPQRRPPAH